MGFVGIKQEEVAFTQQAICFHEPNPLHCIFEKYVTVNPALQGGPNHDTHRAVDLPCVRHFAPLWIMTGGTTSHAALAKVMMVDVSPCSFGTVQDWGTPVSPTTSASFGTSWQLLSLQFQICCGLPMLRSDRTCSSWSKISLQLQGLPPLPYWLTNCGLFWFKLWDCTEGNLSGNLFLLSSSFLKTSWSCSPEHTDRPNYILFSLKVESLHGWTSGLILPILFSHLQQYVHVIMEWTETKKIKNKR